MKPLKCISIIIVGLITCLVMISCKKTTVCQNCADSNKPPLARAGADQTLVLPTDSIILAGGTSSDPDGSITSYKWVNISGPLSNIINPNSSATLVKNLMAGVHEFSLTVKDNHGAAASDTVTLTVIDTLSGKEYIFPDLTWGYDGEDYSLFGGTSEWNAFHIVRSDLFYDYRKKMEVSIKIGNSTVWVPLANLPAPITSVFVNNHSLGMGYSLSWNKGSLYVYNVYQTTPNDLGGTKASIKVKIL